MDYGGRVGNTFLTVLTMISIISIKMAFIHAAEFLALLFVTIPAAIIIFFNKNIDNGDQNS